MCFLAKFDLFDRPVVNFTNILQSAFWPIFLDRKNNNSNTKLRKASLTLWYKKAAQKYWRNWHRALNFINIFGQLFCEIFSQKNQTETQIRNKLHINTFSKKKLLIVRMSVLAPFSTYMLLEEAAETDVRTNFLSEERWWNWHLGFAWRPNCAETCDADVALLRFEQRTKMIGIIKLYIGIYVILMIDEK